MAFHTQDCLDHDLCLVHHGISTFPGVVDTGGHCGDEILEAIDDFSYVYLSRLDWALKLLYRCR
jgi:hypothetical protein